MPPSIIPDVGALERRLAGLPVVKHPAREVVLSAGSQTGKLLFLRSGAVEVVKDGLQIAKVSAPGSVFGEQASLLDQPHTADVRTLEESEFYVADAPAILAGDPTVALYVAAILARRLDAGNRSLIEVKRQIQAGEAASVIGRTVEKAQELLSYSAAPVSYTLAIHPIHSVRQIDALKTANAIEATVLDGGRGPQRRSRWRPASASLPDRPTERLGAEASRTRAVQKQAGERWKLNRTLVRVACRIPNLGAARIVLFYRRGAATCTTSQQIREVRLGSRGMLRSEQRLMRPRFVPFTWHVH